MIVECAVYNEGKPAGSRRLPLEGALSARRAPGAFVWIDLYEPGDAELRSVADEFDLHPLAIEDAREPHQRPKIEVYGETLFVVVKTARYVDPEEVVELDELHVFLGDGFLVVVRHGQADTLDGVRRRLEGDPEAQARGPGAALHAVLDEVVDDYAPAIDGLDNDINEVEKEVFSSTFLNRAERIYKLKREVLEFHQVAGSLLEPLNQLRQGHTLLPGRTDELTPYFRDVHDHLLRIDQRLDNARDLLTSVLAANLTQVGVRQNEDMRKISSWVAMAAVATLIAGIYGMNFDHMPELGWVFGYPFALLLMTVSSVALYRAFKRSGWL